MLHNVDVILLRIVYDLSIFWCTKRHVMPVFITFHISVYCCVSYSNAAVAKARENPQTVQFCEKLGVDNPFNPTGELVNTCI